MALKHFVERRKLELSNTHTKDTILSRLFFIIDNAEHIFQSPDSISIEGFKKIYLKHFDIYENFAIRIIIERVKNKLQIKSMHFQKNKKATS